MAHGETLLPGHARDVVARGEELSAWGTGEGFPPHSVAREAIALYTNAAGIETGYGFFAPNVPDNHKLVYEVRYPDGRVESELPPVGSSAAGLRLTNLLDNLPQIANPELRELIMRMLAYSYWEQHPEVISIRAVLGVVKLPTIEGYRAGETESYEVLSAYDFSFNQTP